MTRSIQKVATECALLLHARIDIVINIHRVLILLLKSKMVDDYMASLTEAKDASNRLVHESRCPPWSCKDDAIHMLKIDTCTCAMNLGKNDSVTRTEKFLDYSTTVQREFIGPRKSLH